MRKIILFISLVVSMNMFASCFEGGGGPFGYKFFSVTARESAMGSTSYIGWGSPLVSLYNPSMLLYDFYDDEVSKFGFSTSGKFMPTNRGSDFGLSSDSSNGDDFAVSIASRFGKTSLFNLLGKKDRSYLVIGLNAQSRTVAEFYQTDYNESANQIEFYGEFEGSEIFVTPAIAFHGKNKSLGFNLTYYRLSYLGLNNQAYSPTTGLGWNAACTFRFQDLNIPILKFILDNSIVSSSFEYYKIDRIGTRTITAGWAQKINDNLLVAYQMQTGTSTTTKYNLGFEYSLLNDRDHQFQLRGGFRGGEDSNTEAYFVDAITTGFGYSKGFFTIDYSYEYYISTIRGDGQYQELIDTPHKLTLTFIY